MPSDPVRIAEVSFTYLGYMRMKPFLPCLVMAFCLSGPVSAAERPDFGKPHLADVEQMLGERNRTLIASRRASMAAERALG